MKPIHISLLVSFACCSTASYAQGCGSSNQFSEGAIECTATLEAEESFDGDYASGVAESRMWRSAFAHCRKVGEEYVEDLIPVPISGSQKNFSNKLDGARVRYSVSRAFYCGGM